MTNTAKDFFKNVAISSGSLLEVRLDTSFSSVKNQYRGVQGAQYATNGFNAAHDRYGWPAANIPGALLLQATDWSKKVNVVARLNGTSTVEDIQLYLRIYRELSYRHYKDTDTKRNYVLPNKPSNIEDFDFSGSIGYPTNISWGAPGYYQIWWLVWEGVGGRKGVLIDWSSLGIFEDETDKNYFRGNPRLNGISTFHSSSSDWQSPFGLMVAEKDDIEYYIDDANEAPINTTEKLNNPPIVLMSPSTVRGTTSLRYVDFRPSPLIGSDAPNILPGAKNAYGGFVWSNVETYVGNQWLPIAVAYEDHERITILKDRATTPAQPTTLGGKPIIGSGPSKNWVLGNIQFSNEFAKGSKNIWASNPVQISGQTYYIKPVIVDGDIIQSKFPYVAGSGPYEAGRDTDWIVGSVGPEHYWYVLPQVVRTNKSGCCANDIPPQVRTSVSSTADDFVSLSLTCTRGMHFGKFLKTEFNEGDIYPWLSFIESAGKRSATSIAAGTLFSGYRQSGSMRTGANMSSPLYSPIAFSLEGLPEFAGYRSAVTIGAGGSGSSTSVDDSIHPTIKEKLNTALSKKAVNTWNVTSIVEFAKTNARALGVPLFDIKSELLQLFYDSKITWYMDERNLSKTSAMSAAANDPVYKALVGLFATTAPSVGSQASSGGSSGAGTRTQQRGQNSGSQTTGNSNQTKTIRIAVTRGLPGYKPGIRQTALTSDKPELVQTYEYFEQMPDGTNVGRTALRRFEFPFVPREVNYSGLGTQWTEIERTGNFPVVDWQSFQLLKISFNFDIVDRRLENQTGFGLYWSCEDQIRDLRLMAQAPYPVTFLNMDQFMSEEVRYPLFTRGRGVEFVIAEFTVTAVQRTPAQAAQISGQLTPNQISRATASMTLQEIPIEKIDIVQMPPIKPCNKKRKKCEDIPFIPTDKDRSYALFTKSVAT